MTIPTNRRAIIALLSAAPFAANASPRELDVEVAGDRIEWLDSVIAQQANKGELAGAMRLGRFRDPYYYLLSPIAWQPDRSDDRGLPFVTVPAGFVTDFASIPRVFWTMLRPDGDYAQAAIFHDYLYWTQSASRDAADLVLKSAMEDLAVDPLVVQAIYGAVRVGGARGWRVDENRRDRGERRILKRYPDDPKITWAEWKRRRDVF